MRVTKKHVYSNSIYLHVLVEVELCSMVASDSINVYSSLGSPVTGLTPSDPVLREEWKFKILSERGN